MSFSKTKSNLQINMILVGKNQNFKLNYFHYKWENESVNLTLFVGSSISFDYLQTLNWSKNNNLHQSLNLFRFIPLGKCLIKQHKLL